MKTNTKYTDIKIAFHYIIPNRWEIYVPYSQVSSYEILSDDDGIEEFKIFCKSGLIHTMYIDNMSIIEEFKFWFEEYLKSHES